MRSTGLARLSASARSPPRSPSPGNEPILSSHAPLGHHVVSYHQSPPASRPEASGAGPRVAQASLAPMRATCASVQPFVPVWPSSASDSRVGPRTRSCGPRPPGTGTRPRSTHWGYGCRRYAKSAPASSSESPTHAAPEPVGYGAPGAGPMLHAQPHHDLREHVALQLVSVSLDIAKKGANRHSIMSNHIRETTDIETRRTLKSRCVFLRIRDAHGRDGPPGKRSDSDRLPVLRARPGAREGGRPGRAGKRANLGTSRSAPGTACSDRRYQM